MGALGSAGAGKYDVHAPVLPHQHAMDIHLSHTRRQALCAICRKKDRPSKHWSTPVRQLSLGDAALPCDGPTAVLRAPAIPPAHGRPHHGKRAAALDPEDYVRDALRSHKRYKAEARQA